MEPLVFLCCDRHAILELYLFITVIFCADTDKLLFAGHIEPDQTLFFFLLLLCAFNRIIQHIAKQCTHIHIFHKRQSFSVHDKLQLNFFVLADHRLICQNSIEYLVSCLILCLIDFDLTFHLFQIAGGLSYISLRLKKIDLMLQIMILLVYHINILF